MKALLVLLALVGSLQFAAGAASVAAVLQRSGSPWADTVGFSGLGLAGLAFVAASLIIWRRA